MQNYQSPFSDRRLRRSKVVQESLHYLSSAVVDRVGLDNVVIVGDSGLALGAAKYGEEATALAAYAQVIIETTSTTKRKKVFNALSEWVPNIGANRISVRRTNICNETFFLIATGKHIGRRDRGLNEVLTGVNRIFKQALAA